MRIYFTIIGVLLLFCSVCFSDTSDFAEKLKTSGKNIDEAYKTIQNTEGIVNRIDERNKERQILKSEVSRSISEIENEFIELKKDINGLRGDINNFKGEIEEIKKSKPIKRIKQDKPLEKTASRGYRVRPGDTLSGISLFMYGNSAMWRKVYEANRDRLENPSVLKVGQELRIP